ncbi:MAG: Stk1 family PASTA domain-containing Ser/Thr kinase, partial [Actinomycetota bacterium]
MTPPNKVLSERYELESQLGSGGMATVYRGTDRVLSRAVAVKVLSAAHARDEAFVERFRREAQSAARLNHPGVVAVFDTGDDGDDHYIVMELVEGRTLADVLEERGPLPPHEAAAIAEQIAVALSVAHGEGIVHRDVKPGNVMLTQAGEVKVVDFGIARASTSDSITKTTSVLGTANYLSPEQAQGHPVDERSDVYSLGVVLYEMLAGRPPFQGDSAVSVAYKHVQEQPLPPSRHNPEVPAELDAVTMKALSKDPAQRYPSAEAMGADLARARGGEAVEAGAVVATATTGDAGAGDGTAAMAPVSSTAVYDEPLVHEGPPEGPVERRQLWPVLLLVGLVVVGAIIAFAALAGGGGKGKPTVSPGGTNPSHRIPTPTQSVVPTQEPTTPPASETPTPTPT